MCNAKINVEETNLRLSTLTNMHRKCDAKQTETNENLKKLHTNLVEMQNKYQELLQQQQQQVDSSIKYFSSLSTFGVANEQILKQVAAKK